MTTARPVQGQKEKLIRLIECPVCLNELQDPRLLSCRHTLCYTCVKDYTKKGNYGNQLPCPVCREVTDLHQGGVDDLPTFFFMNELKVVVTEQDEDNDIILQPDSKENGGVCSAEGCGQPALRYCKDGCQFMCQQCDDGHRGFKLTVNHNVITSSEGETFIKTKKSPYPSCHRHNHQMIDLHCLTCNMPICITCCQLNHRDHVCCELEEQAKTCKSKLQEICKDTDCVIRVVKQVLEKNKQQRKQAEADITDACDNVKSTFKILHNTLDKEERKMLLNLKKARRSVTEIADAFVESQTISLASLESLRSCQMKLTDKDSPYDYVTVTESIKRDFDGQCAQHLPGFMWSYQFKKKNGAGVLFHPKKVEIAKTVEFIGTTEVTEVGRILLRNHKKVVIGLVVYKEHIYTVHLTKFVVYCYSNTGKLCSQYKHMDKKIDIQGMCLIVDGEAPMLVVSDATNDALIWLSINDDFTMDHHKTQQIDYEPKGSYNDEGILMVCDEDHHRIHCYRGDGEPFEVISLPRDVRPWGMTRYTDVNQYIIVDYDNKQVLVIDRKGDVEKVYKGEIEGVEMGRPCEIIRDSDGRILMSDELNNQIVMMSEDNNFTWRLLH